MRVTIKAGAGLRKRIQGLVNGLLDVDLKPGDGVLDLLGKLGLEPKDARAILINGRSIREDEALSEGDRVGLFPAECGAINEIALMFSHRLPGAIKSPYKEQQ